MALEILHEDCYRKPCKVTETGNHHAGHGGDYRSGTLMYDGMTTVVATSRAMQSASADVASATPAGASIPTGTLCRYSFTVPPEPFLVSCADFLRISSAKKGLSGIC